MYKKRIAFSTLSQYIHSELHQVPLPVAVKQ